MKRILLYSFGLFFIQNLNAQTQIGSSLSGVTNSNFGFSVAISSNGSKIVIGNPINTGLASTSQGSSNPYTYTTAWTSTGAVLGEAIGDNSGYVAISDNALVYASGAPFNDGNGADSGHVRVYSWNGSAWVQKGADINGEAAGDRSGFSISLSSDGNVIAIGAYLNDGAGADAGHVRVYSWNGSSWVQRGADLNGDAAGDNFGVSVALSSTGTKLIVGASGNDAGGTDAGRIKTYNWNGSSWVQYGGTINGSSAGINFGRCVSISEDGTKIAVGAPSENNGATVSAGSVTVYSGTTWAQVNNKVFGTSSAGYFGYCVSLSGTGDAFYASQPNSGRAIYYKNNSSSWTQVGSAITLNAMPVSGSNVAISKDGNYTITAGSVSGGTPTVRIHDFTAVLSSSNFQLNDNFSVYPNPTSNQFQLNTDISIDKVEVLNLQGQVIKTFESQESYDIYDLSAGIYLVMIHSEEGKGIKKIIKN